LPRQSQWGSRVVVLCGSLESEEQFCFLSSVLTQSVTLASCSTSLFLIFSSGAWQSCLLLPASWLLPPQGTELVWGVVFGGRFPFLFFTCFSLKTLPVPSVVSLSSELRSLPAEAKTFPGHLWSPAKDALGNMFSQRPLSIRY
jgi:hypothetical protein